MVTYKMSGEGKKLGEIKFILLSSFLLTQFLFFIDEGYYSLTWMSRWVNWVVFCIYFLFFAFGQFLIAQVGRKFEFTFAKAMTMFFVGGGFALWVTIRILS